MLVTFSSKISNRSPKTVCINRWDYHGAFFLVTGQGAVIKVFSSVELKIIFSINRLILETHMVLKIYFYINKPGLTWVIISVHCIGGLKVKSYIFWLSYSSNCNFSSPKISLGNSSRCENRNFTISLSQLFK